MQVIRQSPPTAKGVRFITLEDEDGFINLILYRDGYVRFRKVIREAGILIASGTVQRKSGVTNVVVEKIIRTKQDRY